MASQRCVYTVDRKLQIWLKITSGEHMNSLDNKPPCPYCGRADWKSLKTGHGFKRFCNICEGKE